MKENGQREVVRVREVDEVRDEGQTEEKTRIERVAGMREDDGGQKEKKIGIERVVRARDVDRSSR